MNPLMQMIQGNNPISQIMNILNGGANPQQLAQNILQKNPQAQAMLNSMQSQCGNRNPRDFVLEQCRNRGINESQVMQIANRIGLK